MNVIIGAGLTGLSTAYHLDSDDYIIFEAKEKAGGVCGSLQVDGFTFDCTGHVMHFRHDHVFQLASKLLGKNLHKLVRRSSIYFDGCLIPYPFQMNLFPLPYDVKMECIMGAIKAKCEADDQAPDNFADWILASLGEGIAKHFMFPYNEKLWTVHPREMTTSWLSEFVPQPNLQAILEGALRERKDGLIGYNAEFWYPLRGGIEAYPRAFLPHVDNLHLEVAVESIDTRGRTVLAGGQRHAYTNVISTAPIVELVKMIEGAPEDVRNAAKGLRTNAVYSILLGVGREDIAEPHWIYFPQTDIIFYRAGIPSNLSPHMSPDGTSSICAEVAYRGDLAMSEEELIDRTINDLRAVGILKTDDDILVKKAVNKPYAYAIYDHSRDANVRTIVDYLATQRVLSIGRYGGWEYSSMEDAVLAGKRAAELLNI